MHQPFEPLPGPVLTFQGEHRVWKLTPRQGTAPTDKWTLIGSPAPAEGNPCSAIENGQWATLDEVYQALQEAEREDDGWHEGDQHNPVLIAYRRAGTDLEWWLDDVRKVLAGVNGGGTGTHDDILESLGLFDVFNDMPAFGWQKRLNEKKRTQLKEAEAVIEADLAERNRRRENNPIIATFLRNGGIPSSWSLSVRSITWAQNTPQVGWSLDVNEVFKSLGLFDAEKREPVEGWRLKLNEEHHAVIREAVELLDGFPQNDMVWGSGR
ncbi:hypothetical protein ACFVAJ_17410 [Agromyces sp. NPDC057679]|uniref:hypothetical protein n=1 Tax=Agromyces sp. NPDC057679 TaxID=3346207 RepID=UPI00366C9377